MKDKLPSLVALCLLITLVLTTWWAADYAQKAIPIDPPAPIQHEPDAWSGTFTMLMTDETGKAIHRLSGHSLQHYPDDDSFEVKNAELISIHRQQPRTTAQSDMATLRNDQILLQGNAHIHRLATEDLASLDIRSEELIVLPDEHLVKTDKEVDVQQGNSRLKGKGMIYNNDTRRLEVFANTGVVISPQDLNKATPAE